METSYKKKVNGNKVLVLVAQGESHSTLFLGSLPFKFLTVKKEENISDANQFLRANRANSNLDYRMLIQQANQEKSGRGYLQKWLGVEIGGGICNIVSYWINILWRRLEFARRGEFFFRLSSSLSLFTWLGINKITIHKVLYKTREGIRPCHRLIRVPL